MSGALAAAMPVCSEPSVATQLRHNTQTLRTEELTKQEIALAEAHFRLKPAGVGVQAGSAGLMIDPRTALLYTSAASLPIQVGTDHFVPRRGTFSKAGHVAFLADAGHTFILTRFGQDVSKWMGPQAVQQPERVRRYVTLFKQPPAKRAIVEDVCWVGSDEVLAATSCGQFYMIPRTSGTHRPPPLPMNVQGVHEYVRCMTSIEGESKVVVVGDNGAAQHAETSHQLANALSLSIWDFADSAAPVLTTLVTNQQASLKAGHVVEGAREGWHVEACSTHIAVICPSATGPFTKVLVYALQESEEGAPAVLLPMLTMEDSLLQCASNATWWAPGKLAFAAPFPGMHFLKVLDVTTGQCILLADSCWLLPGTKIVCGDESEGMARQIYVWTPCLQQAPFDRAPGAPVIMRKWKLYAIKPMAPVEDQPHNVDLSEWRTPSLLSRVLAWAARLWKLLTSLRVKTAAVATTGDSSDSIDSITAGSAKEEVLSHAVVRGSSSGTSASHASALDLLQQSISSSSDMVPCHEENSSQAEVQAVEGEATAPPQARPAPHRHLTWSGRPKALSYFIDSHKPESAVAISCSEDISVKPKQQLQRASTWSRDSSIHRQALPSWAPSRSRSGLATSDSGNTILAHSTPQDPFDALDDCSGPLADSSEAGSSQATNSQEFHRTYVVKAGQASNGGIEEVKAAPSLEAQGISSSPRIAAVQSQPQQLQDAEGAEKPAWKVKVDARRARVQQQKHRAVERKKFVRKCVQHSAPFAALLCVLLACLGLYLAPLPFSPMTSSQPGPYIPDAADYLPALVPMTAEPLAEAGVVPATMSEALAVSPQHNRALARLTAALEWVCTPLHLSSSPNVPETAAGRFGRQPAASALGSSVPGMQSVLLGVRDVMPDMSGSMPLIMSSMFSWLPAMVPGAVGTSLEGEEAPAGWQQHSILNSFSVSFFALRNLWIKQQYCSHQQAGHHLCDAASMSASDAFFVEDSSSSPQAADQQASPINVASVQAAFLQQSAAVTEPVRNAMLAQVQALLHEQWLSQSDSTDEELAAADGDRHGKMQHFPAEVLQAAESPWADHPNSLLDLQSLTTFAAVDLATQCVDTTLLLDS